MTFINPIANNNDLAILTDQSMVGSFVSLPILVTKNIAFSFQVVYSGSANGTFTVQSSCDTGASPPSVLPSDWSTITTPAGAPITAAIPANASPLILAYNKQVPWNWIQLVYTASSGSGFCTVRFNGR